MELELVLLYLLDRVGYKSYARILASYSQLIWLGANTFVRKCLQRSLERQRQKPQLQLYRFHHVASTDHWVQTTLTTT
jgi:archaellum component FlaD/FlaE